MKNHARSAMRIRAITPPTTPPTIAPIGGEEDVLGGVDDGDGAADMAVESTTDVAEADIEVEVNTGNETGVN